MHRIDRWAGLALAALGAAVVWSSRSFPAVPGQKLGAGFLPGLVGIGLLLGGLALAWRGLRSPHDGAVQARAAEHIGSATVIMAVVVVYVLAADRLGFLLIAPLGLLVIFRSLRVGWRGALLWALGGTLVVHVAFYKLLRVPLPWGLLRPMY